MIVTVTVLFCGALYLDIQSTQKLRVAINRNVELRNELELFISGVKDAETGQRGYIITGDEGYLAPYTSAIAEIPQHLGQLRDSTAGDPNLQDKIATISSLTKQKLEELDKAIRLRHDQGFEATSKFVMTGQGKATMDDIRRSVNDVDAAIETSFAAQRAQSEQNHAPLVLCAVVLLVVYWLNTLRLERARTEAGAAFLAKNASESKMRLIFETMSEGIVVWLADDRVDAANTSATKMLGCPIEQMASSKQGPPPWNAIHKDGSPFSHETHPVIVTLRTGEVCRNVVMGVPHRDGSVVWLSVNTEPLFYPDEMMPYAVVTTLSDITGHKISRAVVG